MLIRVDLPKPFLPMIPILSCLAKVYSKLAITFLSSKVLDILWISIILFPSLDDPTDISNFSSIIFLSALTSSSNLCSLAFCLVLRA